MSKKQEWLYSTDEERWPARFGEHSNREDARVSAERDLVPDEQFWTGRATTYEVPSNSITADDVLEQVAITAYDEVGDVCEGWPEPSPEQSEELQK